MSKNIQNKQKKSYTFYTLLATVFNFYNPNEGISFYRSFEYWFDNIPFVERNFLNLVSFWLFLIVLILMSPLFYLIYIQLHYIF